MRKFLRRILIGLGILAGACLLLAVALTVDILRSAQIQAPEPADAALILGAAVMGDEPSPVFAERLRYGVQLYQAGTIKALIISGGLGPGDTLSEAEAGRNWAMDNGVPESAILLEDAARTTHQNIAFSLPLIDQHGFGSILIVSDPLHMRRAMLMARNLGLNAQPAPTPTSRYQSFGTQAGFLARELWFNIWYAFTGQ